MHGIRRIRGPIRKRRVEVAGSKGLAALRTKRTPCRMLAIRGARSNARFGVTQRGVRRSSGSFNTTLTMRLKAHRPPRDTAAMFGPVLGHAVWFGKDPDFGHMFRETFAAEHEAAARGELMPWIVMPAGALSLVLADQERSVALCAALPEPVQTRARGHRDIIAEFSRFPHLNAIVERTSTRAKIGWLAASWAEVRNSDKLHY